MYRRKCVQNHVRKKFLCWGDNIKTNLKEYERAWTECIGGSFVQAFEHSGIIDGLSERLASHDALPSAQLPSRTFQHHYHYTKFSYSEEVLKAVVSIFAFFCCCQSLMDFSEIQTDKQASCSSLSSVRGTTYNVLSRRVSVTTVAVEEQNFCLFWVCVCSNAHAPCCHLWLVHLYSIFPHCITNGMIFEKKKKNTKCVFWFSLQFCLKHFSF